MRDIKFRGLTEGGTCVYGDLINYENGRKAIIGRQLSAPGYLSVEGARISPVKAETIGQYTGFQDKNGSEVYEGDIVNIRNDGYADVMAQVVFDIAAFWLYSEDVFLAYDDEADNMIRLSSIYMDTGEDGYLARLEVIGNIHQHPELLDGEK